MSFFVECSNAGTVFPFSGSDHPLVLLCRCVTDVEVMTPTLLTANKHFVSYPPLQTSCCIIYSGNPLSPLFIHSNVGARFLEVTCESNRHFVFCFLFSHGDY